MLQVNEQSRYSPCRRPSSEPRQLLKMLSCRRFNSFVDLFLACISVSMFLLYSDQTLSTILRGHVGGPWVQIQHILNALATLEFRRPSRSI